MQSPREWIYIEKRARYWARGMQQYHGRREDASRYWEGTTVEVARKTGACNERKNRRAFAQEGGSGQPYQMLVSSQAKRDEEINQWLWHIGEWASLGTWWQSFTGVTLRTAWLERLKAWQTSPEPSVWLGFAYASWVSPLWFTEVDL